MRLFNQKPILSLFWLLTICSFPIIAISGRSLQKYLYKTIGASSLGWVLAVIIGVLVLVFLGVGIYKRKFMVILHTLWIIAVFAGIMYYTSRHPERWLHIPLFGLLGCLSVARFSYRAGAEIALSYAFLDELMQFYLPSRNGSFDDVQINIICGLIGILVYYLVFDHSAAKTSAPSGEP